MKGKERHYDKKILKNFFKLKLLSQHLFL